MCIGFSVDWFAQVGEGDVAYLLWIFLLEICIGEGGDFGAFGDDA